MKKNKTVKVKFNKSHPAFAYFKGDIANLSAEKIAKHGLLEKGFVMSLPDDEEDDINNTLPEDLPGREILFAEGFKTADEVQKGGEGVTDLKGIGKGTYKQLLAWFEEHEKKA